jgi:hypothetical protein
LRHAISTAEAKDAELIIASDPIGQSVAIAYKSKEDKSEKEWHTFEAY